MKRTMLVVAAAVALYSASLPAAISDPVKTDAGLLSGTMQEGVRVYKGIPFGAPPVGQLRWKEPQPVVKWEGVRKADTYGNVCVQPSQPNRKPNNVSVDLPDSPKASEDCLYLNVWTNAPSANAKQAVMVWIFGGAYSEGAGSSPHNEGWALAKKGVVVVSLNYRLGPFGFFSHPELTKESGHNASGNQAVLDCIAALKWVKNNIAAFGGDPNNVTIFGESAGAALSAGLVGSPLAKGLFNRAISESGAWMGLSMARMRTRVEAERPAPARAGGRGGNGGAAAAPPPPPLPSSLAELRALPAEEVARRMRGAGMIIDGYAIPEDESITFADGRQNPVDVLVGSNKDEGAFQNFPVTPEQWQQRVRAQWGELADEYLALYPGMTQEQATLSSQRDFADNMHWHMRAYADAMAKKGKKAWVYYFTYEPTPFPGERSMKATHTSEIPYVFNNLRAPRVYPDNSSPEIASKSKTDIELADQVSSYWVNFAKTGDPNGKGLPPWPQFKDKATGKSHLLGPQAPVPSAAQMAIYDKQYAKLMASIRGNTSTR
jgi:para-nitrobenzyl esterase